MKKVDALAKYLRLMIALDSQALPRVHPPEAFLQPCENAVLRQWINLWHLAVPVLELRQILASVLNTTREAH
jgi:hypothetical protein